MLKSSLEIYNPINVINSYYQTVDALEYRLRTITLNKLEKEKFKLQMLAQKLRDLSPYEALKRGYSIMKKDKKIIVSVDEVAPDDKVDIILSDGTVNCVVKNKNKLLLLSLIN
jgi:exodeoxyribonuclease VII large subunit